MHIPDGLFIPINPVTHTINVADTSILLGTWAITIPFLIFAWKKTKNSYSSSFASTLAIMSAVIFAIQMLTFPVAGGTTVHILGGALIAIILGPFAGMLSMTIVLGMQALIFADGGLLAFGANALNMAVIGGLSFFIVKFVAGNFDRQRFAVGEFLATLTSAITTAILTGLEIGVSQPFANSGGILLTVPTMVGVYSVEGLIEATLTTFAATGLMISLPRFQSNTLMGIAMLRRKET